MADVTNSGTIRGAAIPDEKTALTPAEKQKELVRRAQAGDVSAYEDLVRTPSAPCSGGGRRHSARQPGCRGCGAAGPGESIFFDSAI